MQTVLICFLPLIFGVLTFNSTIWHVGLFCTVIVMPLANQIRERKYSKEVAAHMQKEEVEYQARKARLAIPAAQRANLANPVVISLDELIKLMPEARKVLLARKGEPDDDYLPAQIGKIKDSNEVFAQWDNGHSLITPANLLNALIEQEQLKTLQNPPPKPFDPFSL